MKIELLFEYCWNEDVHGTVLSWHEEGESEVAMTSFSDKGEVDHPKLGKITPGNYIYSFPKSDWEDMGSPQKIILTMEPARL